MGDVHVWLLDLRRAQDDLPDLYRFLDSEERARVARFRRSEDGERFVAARGALRTLIADQVGAEPAEVRFSHGPHGKPFLAAPAGSPLQFNLAHSGRLVLIAMAWGLEVGVDVERGTSDATIDELSGIVLCAREARQVERSGRISRRRTFVRFWTRKEAYLKADGRGLALPLSHLDLSRRGGRAAIFDPNARSWKLCPRWRVRSLGLGRSYGAAVAAEGGGWHVIGHRWSSVGSREAYRIAPV